jgi:hypothetical protein
LPSASHGLGQVESGRLLPACISASGRCSVHIPVHQLLVAYCFTFRRSFQSQLSGCANEAAVSLAGSMVAADSSCGWCDPAPAAITSTRVHCNSFIKKSFSGLTFRSGCLLGGQSAWVALSVSLSQPDLTGTFWPAKTTTCGSNTQCAVCLHT